MKHIIGLKTAFFTSIAGMGMALFLFVPTPSSVGTHTRVTITKPTSSNK